MTDNNETERPPTKARLIRLLRQFESDGYSQYLGHTCRISNLTCGYAEKFLAVLPKGKVLPKIAPDGEGGLVMAWEAPEATTLITVDGAYLSAVFGAGLPHAIYIDPIIFDGPRIPNEILHVIPNVAAAKEPTP